MDEFGGTNPSPLKGLGCGCCILALETPFAREVLAGDRHGIYFAKDHGDLAGRISALDQDRSAVVSKRAIARERVLAAYDWEHIVDQYEVLFERLARRSDPYTP